MEQILSKVKHFFIKMQDILVTNLLYLLPCMFSWFYHLKIKRDIFRFQLVDPSGKKADLYQHGKWKSGNREALVTLILHGLHAHPLLMLHLAEMAQKANMGPVYSLHVSYDEVNLDIHRSLLKKAIDLTEKLLSNTNDSLKGIVFVGHSMGAIEAAYRAFVENDRRIISVISIAGRLKFVESINSPCRESLRDTLNKIIEGIQLQPNLPLYQIVGRHDWNASLESTLIRKNVEYYHIVENAMHLNILFHKDMHKIFPEFLQKSSKEVYNKTII